MSGLLSAFSDFCHFWLGVIIAAFICVFFFSFLLLLLDVSNLYKLSNRLV